MTTVTKDSTETKKPKSATREWIESIVFAIVVASAVHWLIIQPYTIPTSSMESSLLTGDFLFVSKLHYGARTPKTLIQFPLTHQTFWGSSIPSYVDWIQMPQTRLPGFSSIKNNDVVVFNVPLEHPGTYERYQNILNVPKGYPIDLRTNYIKRCLAIAGDEMEIKDRQVYINGQPVQNPPNMQFHYTVMTTQSLDDRFFKKYNISTSPSEFTFIQGGFEANFSPATAEELKKLDFIKLVSPVLHSEDNVLFPRDTLFKSSLDNYGPIRVPKKGQKVTLEPKNLALYKDIILYYDHNDDVKEENGKIVLDGKPITEYTFNQNYYWMMGDNRHNSVDSRYWGFVPEDHVVGKAVLVWLSIDPNESWMSIGDKVRWKRLFSSIK
ncbi:signal peptidase I [Xanthocytophaga agilis]|uniref:Signal peptidase I n=1 Tax=Xanthocytophaga agilis TaxID=3048010 RepID=A0AAE3QZ41_9BACT|nr:signal peptidase I [Xanthocytophaga agilis]MDJ1500105.1 signal peptidase I [Xanthocytophaga agilis]